MKTIGILFPEEEFTPHCGSPWFVWLSFFPLVTLQWSYSWNGEFMLIGSYFWDGLWGIFWLRGSYFFFQYIYMYKIILQLLFYSRKKSSLPIVGPLGLCDSLSFPWLRCNDHIREMENLCWSDHIFEMVYGYFATHKVKCFVILLPGFTFKNFSVACGKMGW